MTIELGQRFDVMTTTVEIGILLSRVVICQLIQEFYDPLDTICVIFDEVESRDLRCSAGLAGCS